MVLFGALINALLIIIGSLIGRLLKGIPENMKQTVMYAIGIVVIVMGVQMGLESSNFVIIIICIVLGAVVGEWIDIDKWINRLGQMIELKFGSKKQDGSIAQGFVTSTLIFVIGAMGVLGALNSGLQNDHDLLVSKGIIDGFTAVILSATLGIGVILSSIPVVVYQGAIALLATQITRLVPEAALEMFLQEMTAAGGIMIIGIGTNLLGLTKIRVANLLPCLVFVGIVVAIIF
ncbi:MULTISPECIES: DUF554 domain-containing protein [Psychrobacillus]|uniref:DUF554 domain-containing protein n=1 Tax=Psychrobacillus faecigallinarum TaxID=2762235 RepID=A0ABR8RAQ4_9BACI|nr:MULTISPECIES: DUF554 domain-containing protein [Psychrobacillus]MBD7944881.1 DUF554 domain-containing protein [Psychrobacillus faecigallinarum]QEY21398.1 DUF554 domain-containing protein [Psychrobacillus sp. AK 1817]